MKTLAEWDAFVVSHSEEAYARFHSRLSRTRYPIRGIRIPILRKQAREIARGEDWRAFCDLRADSYELVMTQGLVLAQAKMPLEERCAALDAWLDRVDDWALTDVVESTVKDCKEAYFAQCVEWCARADVWHARFGIVSMLSHYVRTEYLPRVQASVLAVTAKDYYIDMARAWLIQVVAVRDPSAALEMLADARIDRTTARMAAQKMRDSFRIDAQLAARAGRIAADKPIA